MLPRWGEIDSGAHALTPCLCQSAAQGLVSGHTDLGDTVAYYDMYEMPDIPGQGSGGGTSAARSMAETLLGHRTRPALHSVAVFPTVNQPASTNAAIIAPAPTVSPGWVPAKMARIAT